MSFNIPMDENKRRILRSPSAATRSAHVATDVFEGMPDEALTALSLGKDNGRTTLLLVVMHPSQEHDSSSEVGRGIYFGKLVGIEVGSPAGRELW